MTARLPSKFPEKTIPMQTQVAITEAPTTNALIEQQRRGYAAQNAKVREKAVAVIASASGQVPGTLGR